MLPALWQIGQPLRANNTWDGGGGATFLWSNNANWGLDTAPGFGTLIFTGAVGNTNIMDANYSMNQLNWNGSSAWVLNNSGGSVLSLFDNGGTQAKLESLGTGGVTINAPVTFAATAGAAWGKINAVSSSMTFGSGGTLTVNGSAVAGIRLFGGSGAIATTFNNTVSATGKYFATSATGQTVNIGGSFTAANFYLMNTGTLNLNTGGNLNGTAVRLGGDFATTGTQNLALGATFNLTPAPGGLTFAGVVNSVASNTSGALVVNSQNTSGTNTLSNQIALDSALKITQAAGGTLAITQVKGGDNTTGTDLKGNTLTFAPAATGAINHSGTIYNSTGTGSVTLNGAGTLTLSGANTYSGATTVSAGTLSAANIVVSAGNSNLGNTSSAVVLGDASNQGTLSYTGGAATYTRGFTINAGGGQLTNAGSGTLTVATGGIAAGGAFTVGGASGKDITISSAISSTGGLIKTGADTLTLSNTGNSFSGGVTLGASVGTIIANAIGGTNATGLGTGAVAIGTGSTVELKTTSASTAIVINNTFTGTGLLKVTSTGDSGAPNNNLNGINGFSGTVELANDGGAGRGKLAGTINAPNATLQIDSGSQIYVGFFGAQTYKDIKVSGAGNGENLGAIRFDSNRTLTVSGSVSLLGDTTIAAGGFTGDGTLSGKITSGAAGTQTLTLGTASAVNNVTLNGDIGGGTGTIALTKTTASTVILLGANTYTGATLISAGTLQLGNGATTGSLSTSSAITNNGTLAFNRSNTVTQGTDFASVISGSGAVTQIGTGTTIFSGANTYTGATTISAGTLSVATIGNGGVSGNLGAASNAAANLVFDGGTLQYTGATASTDRNFTVNAGKTATFDITTNNLTVSGASTASNGALTKTGTGTLTLSGANTYTGATTVSQGTLVLNNNSAAGGFAAGTITLGNGATGNSNVELQFGSGVSGFDLTLPNGSGVRRVNPITVANTGSSGTATIAFRQDASAYIYTDLTLNRATVLTSDSSSRQARGWVGRITGSGAGVGNDTVIYDAGVNNWLEFAPKSTGVSGTTPANTFSGNLRVKSGNLEVANVSYLGDVPANSNLMIPDAASVTVDAGAALIFVWGDETFDALNGGGSIARNTGDGQGIRTLTIGASGGSGNFSGAIAATTLGAETFQPGVNITKTGSGTQIFSGANTYTGATTVSAGVLRLNGATSLPGGIDTTVGAGESALTLNGGVLGLGAGNFTRNLGTGAGQVQINAGGGGFAAYTADRLVNLGGATATVTWASGSFVPTGSNLILGAADATHTVTFQNPINFNAATRTVQVDNGAATVDAILSGALSNGGLTKTGEGSLTLSGANTYTGATTISAGTLSVGTIGNGGVASGNLGSASSAAANLVFDVGTLQYTGATASTDRNFTINAGKTATFDIATAATNLTVSGASTATTGALTKIGAGTLTLSGFNTFTGAVQVNAETLNIFNDANLGTGITVTLAGGTLLSSSTWLSHPLAISTASTIDTAYGFTTTDNAALTGSGTLTKTGGGTFSLISGSGNTFSGNITLATNGGTLQIGGTPASNPAGGATLGSLTSANTLTVNRGATFNIEDNASFTSFTDRLGSAGNRPAVSLNGGTLSLNGVNFAAVTTQTLGALTLASGASTINVTRNTSGTPELIFSSLSKTSGAFANYTGTALGNGTNDGRILFTSAPTLIGGGGAANSPTISILPGARSGNDLVTYDAVNGIRPLVLAEYNAVAGNNITGAGATQNVNISNATPTAFTALSGAKTINSLVITAPAVSTWAMGNTLTLTSGQFIHSAASAHTLNISSGTLTAGTGAVGTVDLDLSILNSTVTLGANVNNNASTVVGLVKNGAGSLSLNNTADSTYSGSTFVNEGTLTTGITASRRYLGTGAVTVNAGGILSLGAIGATSFSGSIGSPTYTARTGGQIQIANAVPAVNEFFKIESGAAIINAGTTSAGGLDLNTNLNAAAGAVLAETSAGFNAAIKKGGVAIQTALTTPTYHFGLASSINENVTVGTGTPWLGLSSLPGVGVSGVVYGGATANNTLTANSDFTLQGMTPSGSGGIGQPNYLYLGFGASATNITKIATPNGNVNANIVGGVFLWNDNSQYGSAGNKVTFQVSSGASLGAATANAQGVVAGAATAPASIVVQNGGTVFPSDPNAFNGSVTIQPGGTFSHGQSTLTGTGTITHSNGSILSLSSATAVSGATQSLGTLPGTIVRMYNYYGYTPGTSTLGVTQFDSGLNDAAVYNVLSFGAMGNAASATDSLFTLSANGGIGGVLTAAPNSGLSAATGVVAVGPGGGTFAGANGSSFYMNENFALGANTLTIGSAQSYDGYQRLGGVYLYSTAGTNTGSAGSVISVINGAYLQFGDAGQIPDATRLTVNSGGYVYLNGSETVESLTGAGSIYNYYGPATLTLAPTTTDANFSGTLYSSTPANLALTKTGTGTQTLSGANTYTGATLIQGGTLLLSGAGALADTTDVSLTASSSFSIAGINAASETVGSLSGVSGSSVDLGGKNLTVSNNANFTFSGVASGSGGSLTKAGTGIMTLSGNNTYSGGTNLTGGTLLMGASNVLPNTATLNLSSGTKLDTGGFSDTTGALSVTGPAVMDLGTSAGSQLTFSNVGTWSSLLSVWNYTGAPWTPGTDKLIFTSGSNTINLANVQFFSDNGLTQIGTGGGGLIGNELVPVPEPGAVLGGGVLLALVGWRERRRRATV